MILDVAGVQVHYEAAGEGPALVLCHAISAGQGMWARQLSRFSHRARVIVLDARGVGGSGDFVGVRGLKDQLADDIAAVLDAEGKATAFVCGVSFGGVIAQHFAARYPDRVDGLMIVDSYGDSRPLTPGRAAWLAGVYAGSVSNFLPRSLLAALLRRAYGRWPQAAGVLADAVGVLRPWQAFLTRNTINLVDYLPALARGRYPLTVVVGLDSWWRSLRFAEEIVAAVPRARLVTVADSADPTPLCRPEEFDRILAEALDACYGPARRGGERFPVTPEA